MKIEQVSENQIKCTLNRSDLASRQIKISELAYGSEKTKDLFQDMMDQAYSQFGFETSDLPLMIEAIPVSMDCIILMITRVDEPDEVEEDFSEQSGQGNVFRYNNGGRSIQTPAKQEKPAKAPLPGHVERVFSFDSLSTVISLAHSAGGSYHGNSSLYKSAEDGRYYLIFDNSRCTMNYFGMLCNAALEYAHKENAGYARSAYIKEHFEPIIKENALFLLSAL